MTTLGDPPPGGPAPFGPAPFGPAPAGLSPTGPGGPGAVAVAAPAPPRGPGVVPPFPAPPIEGRGRRVGLALGLGAVVLALVLGGGVAAAVGVTRVATSALNEQADVVISEYFDAVRDRRYGAAYDMLCQETKDSRSEAEYTRDLAETEPIASYDVGDIELVQLSAPVDVTYTDGSTAKLRAYLAQNRRTGGFEVCSIEE